MVTEFGIFGMLGDKYAPAGFNAFRETDGKLAIGGIAEQHEFPIEGTNLSIKGIDAPPGFWECDDPEKRNEVMKRNMRGILQLFGIRVHIFPDRIEIHGAIPSQVIE